MSRDIEPEKGLRERGGLVRPAEETLLSATPALYSFGSTCTMHCQLPEVPSSRR